MNCVSRSFATLDIDSFKQYKDTFGYGPCDTLLREFGSMLREHLRKSDIACRYGGDKFVIVLPDSSIADTRERVEPIRVFVKGFEIRYSEKMTAAITFSAGIAQVPEHGVTESELLRAAEEAMYAAKWAGGDRIVTSLELLFNISPKWWRQTFPNRWW